MQNNDSRVSLFIDLGKLESNFRAIRKHVAPCRLMAILKANAYGLGVETVAETLVRSGADMFGVAELREALPLLKYGIPIQVLGNLLPFEIAPAVANGIVCPLNNYDWAKRISDEAVRQGKTVQGAVTVDSGMGRLGMPAAAAKEEILKIATLPNLTLRGIYSHFSSAYMRYDNYTNVQLAAFKKLLGELNAAGLTFVDIDIAASDAISNFSESLQPPFTLARSGINMYGFCDNEVNPAIPLQSILELKTQLAAVRELPAGSSIGYGRMHTLKEKALVGTIAAGYADGLPLALSNRGYVLIDGVLCPVVGRISMDYTTVLVDNVKNPQIGDEVVLIGRQGDHEITMNEWAALKGTHPYELLCSFGNRVKRVYF